MDNGFPGPRNLPKNLPGPRPMPRYVPVGKGPNAVDDDDAPVVANLPSRGFGFVMPEDMPEPAGGLRARVLPGRRLNEKKNQQDENAANLPSQGNDPMPENMPTPRFAPKDMPLPRFAPGVKRGNRGGIFGKANMPVLEGASIVPNGLPSPKPVSDRKGNGVFGRGNMQVLHGMELPAEVAAAIEEEIEQEAQGEMEMMEKWKPRDIPKAVETLLTTSVGGPLDTIMLMAKASRYDEMSEEEQAKFKGAIEEILNTFVEQYKPEGLL